MTKAEVHAFLLESLKSARDIQRGGISSLISLRTTDLQSREPQAPSVFLDISRNLSSLGLMGTALYVDVKRGSPASIPFNANDEPSYHLGLYLPEKSDGRDILDIQSRLDQGIHKYRNENNRKLPGKDGLAVVTKDKVKLWQNQGLVQKIKRPEGFRGGMEEQDRQNGDTLGDMWLVNKYLVALVKASLLLPRSGFSIMDLTREGEVVKRTADFTTVKFDKLINTNHTPRQRQSNFARDGNICGFDGTMGSGNPRELFSPKELIVLHEKSLDFRPSDSQHLVGLDLSGVSDEILGRHIKGPNGDLWGIKLPSCNASLVAHYEHSVDSGLSRLTPDNIVGDYHHIIPRGAFFTLLMLVSFENPELGKWINEAPVDQVVLWARGIKISTIMSKMRNYEPEKIAEIVELCAKNVKRWDTIVNSNHNTISLCKECHRRIIHPDMRYVKEICGYINALEKNKIPLYEVSKDPENVSDYERQLVNRIISGEFKHYADDTPYGLQMSIIHACRTAVMGYGSNYWFPYFGDMMHDRVRHRSASYFKELDKEEWSQLIQNGLPTDPVERNKLAKYWRNTPAQRHLAKYSPDRKEDKILATESKWNIKAEVGE